MTTSDASAQSSRIGGLAIFVGFGFAAGIGLVFALERVGAPDALVTSLGVLLALATLAVIGAATRAPNIMDFLAARRAAPAAYAGLAFAAVSLGLLLCLSGAPAAGQPLPWRGAIAGLAGAALLAGPRWRYENASALSDVLASYYSLAASRAVLALAIAAAGVAIGVAGLELAANTLQGALGVGPLPAVALCAFALVVSVAPGGLKSVLWSDAASGGGVLLVLALVAVLSVHDVAEPEARVRAFAAAAATSEGPGLAAEIAAGIATATFLGFAAPALAVGSTSEALRAGLWGLFFAALGVVLYAIAAEAPTVRPSERAMAATVAWLPAMAFARAGVLAVSRALGLDLKTARARLAVLASGRIALSRAGALAGTALCAFIAYRYGATPERALQGGLALGLAFVAPSLLLTLVPGRSDLSALSAVAVAGVVLIADAALYGVPADSAVWLTTALAAGAVGAATGLCAIPISTPPAVRIAARSDPFVDLPLDAGAATFGPAELRAPARAGARRRPR